MRIQFLFFVNLLVGTDCSPVAGHQAAGPNFPPGSIGTGAQNIYRSAIEIMIVR